MMAKPMKTLQLHYPMIQFLKVVLYCAMSCYVVLFLLCFTMLRYVVLYCAMFATLKCVSVIVNRVENLLRIQ